MNDIDVPELARQIAARMSPDALLSPDDVGALLDCSGRYVTSQYALSPGFPKAIRLTGPDGRRSKPKYRRSAVMTWIEKHEIGAAVRGAKRVN